jgi:hypothetical protein
MVQPGAGSVAAWCDRLLDVALVCLATWSFAYDICVVLRLGTYPAIAIDLALMAAALVVVIRRGWPAPYPHPYPSLDEGSESLDTGPEPSANGAKPGRPSRPAQVVLVSAGVAALAMATSAPFVLVWIPWLIAVVAGVVWAVPRLRDAIPRSEPGNEAQLGARVVLAWTLVLTVMATVFERPNPDDLYYVNYSQWVASHGVFPLRDTLFSAGRFPAANWPPVASYDALVGTLARVLHAHAASVEYFAVPPAATALAVLALWRLLRAWRVRRIALVISAGLIFMMFDGTSSYASPGNLFVTRLWQGKVILLCVMVPLLLVYALRYVERPSRSNGAWLFLGSVGAVGLTTTAIFMVPLIALAGAAPLIARSWRSAAASFASMAVYPLAAGVVTVASGGRSADDFGAREPYRFDGSWIGHAVFLTALVALIGVAAVLVAVLLVPHPAARVTTALLALWFGLVMTPGVTHAGYGLIGLGPTLWRVSWGMTVAALTGLAIAWVGVRGAQLAATRLHGRWQERARRPGAPGYVLVLLLILLIPFGPPIWSADAGTSFQLPFHWQRSDSTRSTVAAILERTQPGDLVLAPDSVSITLVVTQNGVRAVAPRLYFLHYLHHRPGVHYPDRRLLERWVNNQGRWDVPGIEDALRTVRPDVVCLHSQDFRRYHWLLHLGYTPFDTSSSLYRCLEPS